MGSRGLLLGWRPGRGKGICVVLLVLLVLLCGLHIAGSHSTPSDGPAAAEMLAFLALSLVLTVVVLSRRAARVLGAAGPRGGLLGRAGPGIRRSPAPLLVPLRC